MPNSPTYRPVFAPIVALIDFSLVISAGFIAHTYRFGYEAMTAKYQVLSGGTALLIVFSLTVSGVYDSWRGRRLHTLLKRYSLGLGLGIAALGTFLIFTKTASEFSRIWLALFILLFLGTGLIYRSSYHFYLRHLRHKGRNIRNVIMFTTDKEQSRLSFNQEETTLAGYNIASYKTVDEIQAVILDGSMAKELGKTQAHEIWLNLPLSMGKLIKDIVYALRHETVDIRFFPDFEDIQLLNHKVSDIAGHYSVDISCTPLDGINRSIKRMEDIVIGTVISILITPICCLIACLIKVSSPGPILFKQYRNGLDGKRFKVYKFRTMKTHTEAEGQITQAQKQDSRITKIGSFLRRTSLDELPQFFNVLQGRMSIVGPRPHALAHNEYYKDLVESYMWRHKVKPGITGFAQVQGYRGETDTLDKMEKRVECDLAYINNWSFWFDLKIIMLTVYKGFMNKNAY